MATMMESIHISSAAYDDGILIYMWYLTVDSHEYRFKLYMSIDIV